MQRTTKRGARPAVLGLLLCVLLAGCHSQDRSAPQGRRYALKGAVVSIDKAQQQLIVNHEAIPGFMAAMTMGYPVADAGVLDRVAVGDEITADVVVTEGSARLENVVVVKKAPGSTPAASFPDRQPEAGDSVPDFALVNQDGRRIGLRQYPGKAVLLTFIYTRCPLQDYCPLMTRNFAAIEKALAMSPDLYAKTHLLSVSFDPKNDTPDVLRAYARPYLADRGKQTFDHWEFASIAPSETKQITQFFNLFYNEQSGQIVHSLSTAIISPGGHLYRWYHGNDWKTADVLADLARAVPGQPVTSLGVSLTR